MVNMEEVDELVKKYTRKELNRIALNEGVTEAESLPNKEAVASEIVKARKTKKYIKKPIGLYLADREEE